MEYEYDIDDYHLEYLVATLEYLSRLRSFYSTKR